MNVIYTVTVIRHAADTRMWGWYSDLAVATEQVLANATDMFESYYSHAVIEETPKGILPIAERRWWFKATRAAPTTTCWWSRWTSPSGLPTSSTGGWAESATLASGRRTRRPLKGSLQATTVLIPAACNSPVAKVAPPAHDDRHGADGPERDQKPVRQLVHARSTSLSAGTRAGWGRAGPCA